MYHLVRLALGVVFPFDLSIDMPNFRKRLHTALPGCWRQLCSTTTSYEYTPLDPSRAEIRLVRLLPGNWNDEIWIELEAWPFKQATESGYEALSYVWGDNQDPSSVTVASCERNISITRNLDTALRHVRLKDSERILWIDALSINQQDLTERGEQVQRMAEIYSSAGSVVAWVGSDDERELGRFALQTLRSISDHVGADWGSHELISRTGDGTWADQDVPTPLEEGHLAAIANLLQRPWFTRLWIWQEIQLGGDRAILMCGKNTIPWRTVCDAVYILMHKGLPVTSSSQSVVRYLASSPQMEYIHSLCDNTRLDFLTALHRSRLAQCTDARDKIYAVLSLVNGRDFDIGIRPDYHKREREVYQEAALAHIAAYSNLDVLLHIGRPTQLRGLPSWVPDWTMNGPRQIFHYVEAGPCANPPLRRSGKILHVKGKIVARIESIKQFNTGNLTELNSTEVEERLREMLSHFPGILKSLSAGDELLLRSLSVVLSGNWLADRVISTPAGPSLHWPSSKSCEALLSRILFRPEEDGRTSVAHDVLVQHCYGRALFKTEKGRLGLAPDHAKVGDVIAVIAGCKTAVILRPACFRRYRVVGSAYLEGYMNGEAMFGPLPAFVAPVLVFDANVERWVRGWREKRNAEIVLEDPRLKSGGKPEMSGSLRNFKLV